MPRLAAGRIFISQVLIALGIRARPADQIGLTASQFKYTKFCFLYSYIISLQMHITKQSPIDNFMYSEIFNQYILWQLHFYNCQQDIKSSI